MRKENSAQVGNTNHSDISAGGLRHQRGRIRWLGKLAPWTVEVENESKHRKAAKRYFNYGTMRSAFLGDRIKQSRKALGRPGSQRRAWMQVQQDAEQTDPELGWEFPPIGVLRHIGRDNSPGVPHTVNASRLEEGYQKDGG